MRKRIQRRLRKPSLPRQKRMGIIPSRRKRLLIRTAIRAVRVAQEILSSRSPGDCFIFLGMGMRPVFEAYSLLNRHASMASVRSARFFIGPRSPDPTYSQNIELVRQRLIESNIVKPVFKRYRIIDYRNRNNTFRSISRAILLLNPRAEVSFWSESVPSSRQSQVVEDIRILDMPDASPQPTRKEEDGRHQNRTSQVEGNEYLFVTQAINTLILKK